MTTSYFSSTPAGSNFGLKRGTGGGNEGRTRKSREEVENSVKTGIFFSSSNRREGHALQGAGNAFIPMP
jgi:hypothetical protein